MLGKKFDRGVHDGEYRHPVSKDGSDTNESSLWELGHVAGSAAWAWSSRNMEEHRPLVLVAISVRSDSSLGRGLIEGPRTFFRLFSGIYG